MSLELASRDDLEPIMRIERTPGYQGFIGGWTREDHLAHFGTTDARYLVWREDGEVAGFTILLKLTDPGRVVLAKRVATARTDRGVGGRMIPAVMDWVFENTDANRLELDCSMENPRGLRVYEREGFVREGVAREVYRLEDGRYVSSALFSILRREWEALRGRT